MREPLESTEIKRFHLRSHKTPADVKGTAAPLPAAHRERGSACRQEGGLFSNGSSLIVKAKKKGQDISVSAGQPESITLVEKPRARDPLNRKQKTL